MCQGLGVYFTWWSGRRNHPPPPTIPLTQAHKGGSSAKLDPPRLTSHHLYSTASTWTGQLNHKPYNIPAASLRRPSRRCRPPCFSSATSSTVCSLCSPSPLIQEPRANHVSSHSRRPHRQRHRHPLRRPLPRAQYAHPPVPSCFSTTGPCQLTPFSPARSKPLARLVRPSLRRRPRRQRQGQGHQPDRQRADHHAQYVCPAPSCSGGNRWGRRVPN